MTVRKVASYSDAEEKYDQEKAERKKSWQQERVNDKQMSNSEHKERLVKMTLYFIKKSCELQWRREIYHEQQQFTEGWK